MVAVNTGFTLVELLVVIAIISLLSGMALLSSAPVRKGETSGSLSKCRTESIRTGQLVHVRIDTVWHLCLPDGQALGARIQPLVRD